MAIAVRLKFPLLFCTVLAFANGKVFAGLDYDITPESIRSQIAARGISTVHHEIFSDHYAVNMLLLSIDSGHRDWLQLAQDLAGLKLPVSESRLMMAMGEALQWKPAAVLELSLLEIDRVCSTQGFYEWRLFSRFLAETALTRRIEAVEQLEQNELALQRKQCLLALERAAETIRNTLTNRPPRD